jgi:type IV pilus assembly protein PilB
MVQERKLIGQILIDLEACTADQVQRGLAHQKKRSIRLGDALIELKFCTERDVTRALCRQWKLRFVDLEKLTPSSSVVESVAANIVSDYRVVPVKRQGDTLIVAVDDPLKIPTLDNLRFLLNAEIQGVLATPTGIRRVMKELYDIGDGVAKEASVEVENEEDLGDGVTAEDAPVVRLVHRILRDALEARASDVHVEPLAGRLRVRYRIDGRCREITNPPKHLQGPVLSRIKLMAGMDIAEKRKPQDGRIQIKLLGRDIDLRVSSLPAYHGESIVMRILDKEVGLVSLEELGFHPEDHARFQQMIKRPSGIFLVTGPTGSGKTTSLYAALKELNRPDVKIITAEDPVEYHIPGINQCQVLRQVGLDFPRILRSMLRQAPNIILVGEIRDLETAEIAIQAALTGHLVFSTLHTNDAPSALTRLIDMGVKPFLVSTAVSAIMAQRLVRRLCPDCRESYTPETSELRSVGLDRNLIGDRPIYRAVGCDACGGEGYHGRVGVFELFEMNAVLRQLAFEGAPTQTFRTQAIASGGMITLQQDGVRKIFAGTTTIDEILAVTHSGDIAASVS